MNTERITTLLKIGQLSLDFCAAERAMDFAKRVYHAAWRSFECGGEPEEWDDASSRINRGSQRWDEAIVATQAEYEAYQAAKRQAYNIKRRWLNACRKAT